MNIITREQAMANGLRYYFTGKSCSKGHVSSRQTNNRTCIACQLNRSREWARVNPEKMKAKDRAYYTNNPEKVKAKERRRKRDRAKVKASFRRWAAANGDKYRAGQIAWKTANRDKARLIQRAYKARKRSACGKYSSDDIFRLVNKQNGKCNYFSYCGRRIDGENGFHIDHVMPLALGGNNFPENLQLLCPRCNQQKGACHPDVFAAQIRSNPPHMAEAIGRAVMATAEQRK